MKLSKADYITLCNGICGFLSIVCTLENNLPLAFILIVLAHIFDILDGLVAKFFKEKSKIGGELDSLCDAISFIVAGPLIVYKSVFSPFGIWGGLTCALVTVCGVLRLARFNLSNKEDTFDGVPTTVAGTFLSALALSGVVPNAYLFGLVVVAVSSLMISTIPYPSFKSLRQKLFVVGVFLAAFLISWLSGYDFARTFEVSVASVMGVYIFVLPFIFRVRLKI